MLKFKKSLTISSLIVIFISGCVPKPDLYRKMMSNEWIWLESQESNTDGVYEGEIIDGSPHGKGTMKLFNGLRYVGSFKYGLPHGDGTEINVCNKNLSSIHSRKPLHINFRNNIKTVTVFWNNYRGKLKKYGIINVGSTFKQNTFLTHPWTFIGRDGICLLTYVPKESDNNKILSLSNLSNNPEYFQWKYIGEFKEGKYHGKGTLTYENGETYIGEWKDGDKWNVTKYNRNRIVLGKIVNGVELGSNEDRKITKEQDGKSSFCSKDKWTQARNIDTEYSLNKFKNDCKDTSNQYYKLAVIRLAFIQRLKDKCSKDTWETASNKNTVDSLREFIKECNKPNNQHYKLANQSLSIKLMPKIEEPTIAVIKKDKDEIAQAVVLPIGVLGEISETKKIIIHNKFMDVISNDYDLVSQEEYERAEEEAFQELDYEECTEDQCIKMIQEILQVENMYKIQLVKDGNDIQVSLTYIDLDKKLVQTDFCENCKTSSLIKMINKLYSDLGKKR